MKKIIGDFSTTVKLEADEAKHICKLGQGEECCAFLVCGPEGFECVRESLYPRYIVILNRLKNGKMNAKGQGGWLGCAWEGAPPKVEVKTEEKT